ncbi:MAG: glycosyltransferase family 4 protein, partial [Elusimicrobiota bacterium]
AYRNTKDIKRLNQKHDFDIIHTQGAGAFTSDIVTAHSCHRAAIKKINRFDREELSFYKYLLHKIYRLFKPTNRVVLFVERRILKGAKRIISVSKGVKQEIIENYSIPSDKISVVPNGVNLEEFKPRPEKDKIIRRKYNISEDSFLLFFCAHEFRRKGLATIIKSLPRLKEKVFLLIGGKDNPTPYKKLAERLGVSNQVIFAGNIPENINFYYSASDVFIFPTLYEPFGLVIVEAISSGLPVITSELTGASELIEEGETGLLLNSPSDSDEIATEINKLLENPNLLSKMEKNTRGIAEDYSWQEVTKKTEQVYKEVKDEKS